MSQTFPLTQIVATDTDFSVCRRSVEALCRQRLVERVELMIVCPSAGTLGADPKLDGIFGKVTVVECPPTTSGTMVAAGIRAASGDYVMYVEEHNFPPENTVETLIETTSVPGRPAIGLGMLPANPGVVAWSHLYGQFGHAVAAIASGPVDRFGGHHAVYERDMLLRFDDRLETIMDNEAVLHEVLRRDGVTLWMCGEIVVPHVQVSKMREFMTHEFLSQRAYGAFRAQELGWGPGRKLIYTLGSPLIPFLRLKRSVGHVLRSGRAGLLPQIAPTMLLAFLWGTAGEVMGYLFGVSDAEKSARMDFELDRYAYTRDADRKAETGARTPESV